MSVSRGFHTVIIAIIISLLFATACGSTTTVRPTGTSSLALQSSAPVWGGDAQPATTDVVRGAITVQQAEDIAKACSNARAELPNSEANTCENMIQKIMLLLKLPCPIAYSGQARKSGLLCLEVARVSQGQVAQPDGFIQIVDTRPGKPLCSSRPDGLCFRLGAQDQELQRVTSLAPTTTTSTSTACPTPTDTTCPTSTDTTGPTSTDTTSSTPTGTTSPTSTDTTSPTPTGTARPSPTTAPAASPARGSNS